MSGGERPSGRATRLGGRSAALAALCCFAGPAILDAVAGATTGSTLGIVAAIACASAVAAVAALFLHGRRKGEASGC